MNFSEKRRNFRIQTVKYGAKKKLITKDTRQEGNQERSDTTS